MATKQQLTGMTGLYLVAAELSRRGFIASATSRSAQGADLLITDRECCAAFSIPVKTNASSFGFWLMGEKNRHMRAPSLAYALVNLRKDRTEFFLVPSAVVADRIRTAQRKKKSTDDADLIADALAEAKAAKSNTWYWFDYKDTIPYANNWPIFNERSA
jgi:hypothetical protein